MAGENAPDADHIATAQLPKRYQRGRQTLIRTDSAGGTHAYRGLGQRTAWYWSNDSLQWLAIC